MCSASREVTPGTDACIKSSAALVSCTISAAFVSCTCDLYRCTDDYIGRRCQERRADIVTDDDINVGESMYIECDWLVYSPPTDCMS